MRECSKFDMQTQTGSPFNTVKQLKRSLRQYKRYLDIDFEGKQTILGKREDVDRDLSFIIVK